MFDPTNKPTVSQADQLRLWQKSIVRLVCQCATPHFTNEQRRGIPLNTLMWVKGYLAGLEEHSK